MKLCLRFSCLFMSAVLLLLFCACKNEIPRGADTPQEAVAGFMQAIVERDSESFNKYCLAQFEKETLQTDLNSGAWDGYLEYWEGNTVAIEEYPDDMLTTGQKIIYREYHDFFDGGAPINVDIDTSAITKFYAVYLDEHHWKITVRLNDRWYVDVLTNLDGYFGY